MIWRPGDGEGERPNWWRETRREKNEIMKTGLLDHLRKLKQGDWDRLVAELGPGMHPVDRDAVFIWFSFWPLTRHFPYQPLRDLLRVSEW